MSEFVPQIFLHPIAPERVHGKLLGRADKVSPARRQLGEHLGKISPILELVAKQVHDHGVSGERKLQRGSHLLPQVIQILNQIVLGRQLDVAEHDELIGANGVTAREGDARTRGSKLAAGG
jgi:hypothetical protein